MNKRVLRMMISLCCALLTLLIGVANEPNSDSVVAHAEDVILEATQPAMMPNTFSLYYCTKEEFISYCLEHKIRPDKIEYAWDLIRGQYSVDELSQKYYLEYDTIKRDRWKYKKKLGKHLDKQ